MQLSRRLIFGAILVISVSFPLGTAAGELEKEHSGDASVGSAPDFDLPAVSLRITLDRVLAEHAFLTIEAMRTGIAGGAEFEVAAEVLEANTVELLDLVEAAYGSEAAAAFGEQWRNHLAYLVDYTRAVADGDDDARELASSQLQTYTKDFSELLAAANPGLPPDVVEGLIVEHVQQLEQIGSFADAGFTEAYPSIRDTYAHMFMVGDGLTVGIVDRFGDRFTGRATAFSPALDLRIALDRLLGEHMYFAAIAMRASLADADDLDAAIAALDDNSADLTEQISAIYGEDAGEAFGALWRSHTRFYLDYVEAVAGENRRAQRQALNGLRIYRSDFSSFLAGANPFLEPDALESLLATHTEHLVDQVTAYQAEEYEAAYQALRDGYAQTEMLAAGLGGAIADQFPLLFPDAAVPQPSQRGWLTGIGLMLAMSAIILSGRRRDRASGSGLPPSRAHEAGPRGTHP